MNLWEDKCWTPMLLKEIKKPFSSKDYIYEVKFDGIRALIFVSPTTFKIFNRHHIEITHLYPELALIQSLVKRETIFDGEIVAMDKGAPSFEKLQERAHLKSMLKIKYAAENNSVVFICFDLLYDHEDLINLSQMERKRRLQKYKENAYFIKCKWILHNGVKLFESVKQLGLEGIVAKEKNASYSINQRTDAWIKIKNIQSDFFYIGGYIEKDNRYTISLILGEYRDGFFYYVGKVTLGKKRELYKKVKAKKHVNKSFFVDFENDDVVYIAPNLKCKVNFIERTKNNHLRQPFI